MYMLYNIYYIVQCQNFDLQSLDPTQIQIQIQIEIQIQIQIRVQVQIQVQIQIQIQIQVQVRTQTQTQIQIQIQVQVWIQVKKQAMERQDWNDRNREATLSRDRGAHMEISITAGAPQL